MRFELLLLDAVDSSLGRVDHESLPQLSLMEMVVKEIANKDDICGDADEPKEIEEWKGVEIEDGEVVAIMWGECDLKGSVCLEWLPSSVREFVVTWNRLTGTVNLASLPTSLKGLELGGNAFTGSICLERLPERMGNLSVFHNKFYGSLKLESLPDTLTHFNAQ